MVINIQIHIPMLWVFHKVEGNAVSATPKKQETHEEWQNGTHLLPLISLKTCQKRSKTEH